MTDGSHKSALAWIGIPFLVYLGTLRHFWFNAPIWDDYDAVLWDMVRLHDARSPTEWLGLLLAQHNEHRVAFARLVTWLSMQVVGQIDFRVLTAAANLAWAGILGLLWAELRQQVRPAVLAAAAVLLLNLAYYEASLLPMAGLSNFWVVLFAFASLYFALREGSRNAALGLAFGLVAVVTQASGLLVLPLAAAFCMLSRRPSRAALYGAAALLLWSWYFIGFYRPGHHPTLLFAVSHPWEAVRVFLLIAGGLFPKVNHSIAVAVVLLIAIAWALRRGLWRRSPVMCAWIAFILVSAALITVARAGFGVYHASRYAIYGSTLMVLALLSVAIVTAPWKRPVVVAVVIASVCMSVWISWTSLPHASTYTFRARLLAKAQPQAPDMATDPYFGVFYPVLPHAHLALEGAERRGLWRAREGQVHPTAVRFEDAIPASYPRAGRVDRIDHSGRRVIVVGWSHLPASMPGRVLTVAGGARPIESWVKIASRPDVATATGAPALVYSGFELRLDYASEEAARVGAASLCVAAEAPGQGVRMLAGTPGCPEASPPG